MIPRPSSEPGLSYFKLRARPGYATRAGAIELRNPTAKRLRVVLGPVDGQTLGTLGSGYAPPGSRAHRSTLWLRAGAHAVTLPPGRSAFVPVSVLVPAKATPGDYLSGVSIEALNQRVQSVARKGISIASVARYAIGVEVTLPGPRHPLIRFTGAGLERQPAGLTFLLLARNSGNVILQNVQGTALITQGPRVIARLPLGPGTFVTRSSIAYPILTPRERPRQGTVFRVRASLRYAGGIARLDTLVRFGRADALRQQAYGGPKAPASSGLSAWLVALLGLLGALLALGLLVFLRGRRRAGSRSPVRTLEAALEATRQSGEPLSLITVVFLAGGAAARELAPVLRSRLRHADRLCRLNPGRFLVVAPDTDPDAAERLAADMRRHVERAGNGSGGLAIEMHWSDGDTSAAELLQRVTESNGGAHVPTPTG